MGNKWDADDWGFVIGMSALPLGVIGFFVMVIVLAAGR